MKSKYVLRKFPESLTPFIFFSDEKVFTGAVPVSHQNDRFYTPQETKKRDIGADCLLCTLRCFALKLQNFQWQNGIYNISDIK